MLQVTAIEIEVQGANWSGNFIGCPGGYPELMVDPQVLYWYIGNNITLGGQHRGKKTGNENPDGCSH